MGRAVQSPLAKRYPFLLAEVPREEWPSSIPRGLMRCWLSRTFLVQEYEADAPAVVRLTVCRTTVTPRGFRDGITWDDLQRLKAEAGYADWWAVEVFPADAHVVNVANMRHLWILAEPPEFAWREK